MAPSKSLRHGNPCLAAMATGGGQVYVHPFLARGRQKPPRLAPRAAPPLIVFFDFLSPSGVRRSQAHYRPWSLGPESQVSLKSQLKATPIQSQQAGRQAIGQTSCRQTDRQTCRQTCGQAGRQIDMHSFRQTDRQTCIRTDMQADRQTGRQTDRQTDRQKGRPSRESVTADRWGQARCLALRSGALQRSYEIAGAAVPAL